MNLYLLLAIALGAITGTTEAPVARPAFAVVAKSGVRAERQVARAVATLPRSTSSPRAAFAPWRTVARVDAPLTGAGTPRAPSA